MQGILQYRNVPDAAIESCMGLRVCVQNEWAEVLLSVLEDWCQLTVSGM